MLSLPAALLRRLQFALFPGDRLPVVRRLPETTTDVGLSFDDGPTPETTPSLIALLNRHGARATFFLPGERAILAPDLLRALVEAGHDIFPHGWRHIRYGRQPVDQMIRDLDRAEALLSKVRPTPSPYLVRLPYGSGHKDPRVHRAIRTWRPDAQIAHWNYVMWDWKFADGCSEESQVERRCATAAERAINRPAVRGSILLLHEKPFDVSAPFNARVAPLLTSALLSRMSSRGLRGRPVAPLPVNGAGAGKAP